MWHVSKLQNVLLIFSLFLVEGCSPEWRRGILNSIQANSSGSYESTSNCLTTELFAGGSGTALDPYLICNSTHLANISASPSSYFKQTRDIDLSSISLAPIADEITGFTGTYDGNGYKITGFNYTNTASALAIGLFRAIGSGGIVKNLKLVSASVSGGNASVGGIAGYSSGTITDVQLIGGNFTGKGSVGAVVGTGFGVGVVISNTTVENATVTSNGTSPECGGGCGVGGIAGKFCAPSQNASFQRSTNCADYLGNVSNSDALMSAVITKSVTVTSPILTGALQLTGGLIGYGNFFTISSSSSSGTILGKSYVGGIMGGNDNGVITDSSSSASVTGSSSYVGGIAGLNADIITRTYFTGSATGVDRIGGIAGRNWWIINESYSIGTITGSTNVGGIKGSSNNPTNSYALDQQPAGFAGLTPAQMQDQANFTGFDFTTPKWKMPSVNPGAAILSPVLSWQCGLNGIVCP